MHIDLRVKFKIAAKLDEVTEINEAGEKSYAFGWTDMRVARDLGVTGKQVQAVRRAYCPEMVVVRGGGDGRPPRNIRLREEVNHRFATLDSRLSRIEAILGGVTESKNSSRAA
jgi:hypothetical protein